MKNLLSLLLFFFIVKIGIPQYYITGQDPYSLDWAQIQTENFQVIFPSDYDSLGNAIANKLEKAYEYTSYSLGHKPKKVSIILHTEKVESNGMVIWAPKRMEWFSTPPQDNSPQDWLNLLAIHELRHVVQIDKLNQGLTKIMTYLFGEQITASVLGLYVPVWFLEGDAVLTETLLSESGRGRIPEFTKDYKALLLEKYYYSYDKAVFGSYKDYVPNHYKLGYLLVTNGRREYGSQLWGKVIDEVARKPYSINPFSRKIKNITGFHKRKFYEHTMQKLDKEWSYAQDTMPTTNIKRITNRSPGNYSNYYYPVQINKNEYIALKRSFDHILSFVRYNYAIQDEEVIFQPGGMLSNHYSFSDSILCWAEKQYDKRWNHRSYSIIKTYDLETRKAKAITDKTKYFSPTLSKNGKKIAAVEIQTGNKYSIVIIDRISGKVEKKIVLAANDLPLIPSWDNKNEKIVCVIQNQKGKKLVSFHLKTNSVTELTKETNTELSQPFFYNQYVVFNAAYSGVDNFYALDTVSKEIKQITSAPFSAKFGNTGKVNNIVFSDYTSDGYQIATQKLSNGSWKDLKEIKNYDIKLYEGLLTQEKGIINFEEEDGKDYEVKNYSRLGNLFNFHSWSPVYINTYDYNIAPGFSLFSQNMLNTAITSFGYGYDVNEGTGKYYGSFTYKGFYPEFSINGGFGERSGYYEYADGQEELYYWDEANVNFYTTLPLSWGKNAWFYGIFPSLGTTYFDVNQKPGAPDDLFNGSFQSVNYGFGAYRQKKMSKRDIRPDWGQTFSTTFMHTPLSENNLGNILAMESSLYFPGVVNHHNLELNFGFQAKELAEYEFSDIVRYCRGYTDVEEDEYKFGYVNYRFPFGYPDYNLGGITYVKRLKANIFHDYGIGAGKKEYQSMGFDITADLHLFRLVFPFEFGLRNVYIPGDEELFMQFILNINYYDVP